MGGGSPGALTQGWPRWFAILGRHTRAIVAVLALVTTALAWLHYTSLEQQTRMMRSDFNTILTDPKLRDVALHHGREVFLAHCSGCHGAQGKGNSATAVPDLTDNDFLYGRGEPGEIEQIVLHGIRSGDSKGWSLAAMPAFAWQIPYPADPQLPPLTPAQLRDLVVFLRAANGSSGYDPDQIVRGRNLFDGSAGCWDCHGNDAAGDSSIGAPNLVDGKWLKGNGSETDIAYTIEHGLADVSPAFAHFLSAYDARTVAVYTASLHSQAKSATR